VDLFADVDLAASCQVIRGWDYPGGLASALSHLDDLPWMYTGGLENEPELIASLAAQRPLWGNSAEVVRRVRDPWQVANVLRDAGFHVPDLARSNQPVSEGGTWLAKPFKSSGGARIRCWPAGRGARKAPPPGSPSRCYLQRYMPGVACGAVYVAAAGTAALLSVTQQLIGTPWTGAKGFQYAGSIGPVELSRDQADTLRGLGTRLADAFRLQGLFGVDVILSGDQVWPLEVNPRYTASVEIIERTRGICAVDWHVRACRDGVVPETPPSTSRRIAGKAIVYARRSLRVGVDLAEFAAGWHDGHGPSVADIPAVGENIGPGCPVVTVFAEGSTLKETKHLLQDRCLHMRRQLDDVS
jgi:predicted ATP-grasp superfamily ATP-dependent carboligase